MRLGRLSFGRKTEEVRGSLLSLSSMRNLDFDDKFCVDDPADTDNSSTAPPSPPRHKMQKGPKSMDVFAALKPVPNLSRTEAPLSNTPVEDSDSEEEEEIPKAPSPKMRRSPKQRPPSILRGPSNMDVFAFQPPAAPMSRTEQPLSNVPTLDDSDSEEEEVPSPTKAASPRAKSTPKQRPSSVLRGPSNKDLFARAPPRMTRSEEPIPQFDPDFAFVEDVESNTTPSSPKQEQQQQPQQQPHRRSPRRKRNASRAEPSASLSEESLVKLVGIAATNEKESEKPRGPSRKKKERRHSVTGHKTPARRRPSRRPSGIADMAAVLSDTKVKKVDSGDGMNDSFIQFDCAVQG